MNDWGAFAVYPECKVALAQVLYDPCGEEAFDWLQVSGEREWLLIGHWVDRRM